MKTSSKIALGVVAFIFIIIVISQYQSDRSMQIKEPDRIGLVVVARDFVKRNLKAPSTAESGTTNGTRVNSLGNNQYEVSGYIDAQNSFGAMLRNNFYVKMEYHPARDTYTLLDIRVEQEY